MANPREVAVCFAVCVRLYCPHFLWYHAAKVRVLGQTCHRVRPLHQRKHFTVCEKKRKRQKNKSITIFIIKRTTPGHPIHNKAYNTRKTSTVHSTAYNTRTQPPIVVSPTWCQYLFSFAATNHRDPPSRLPPNSRHKYPRPKQPTRATSAP